MLVDGRQQVDVDVHIDDIGKGTHVHKIANCSDVVIELCREASVHFLNGALLGFYASVAKSMRLPTSSGVHFR